jgi:hypothetical protein
VHGHHHKIGHRWIDLALALSALLLSIASITIAIENDRSMKRLVTANSWPYLEMGHGNALDGQPTIHFSVENAGIGPAMIEKFVVAYDGQPVNGSKDLLARCCGTPDNPHAENVGAFIDLVAERVMAAHENIQFLQLTRQDNNLGVWNKLNTARFKIDMSICYSSVFGEHWITSMNRVKPRSVDSCDELQGPNYDTYLLHPPGG